MILRVFSQEKFLKKFCRLPVHDHHDSKGGTLVEWRQVSDFYGYLVNNEGEVKHEKSRTPLTYHLNQQGIPSVVLYANGEQYRRSVALLVAQAFLPTPPAHFRSIIHMDGDRLNCDADNLAWRPRWFAVKYQQERRVEPYPDWYLPFEIMETGEQFKHPRDFAMQYGTLEEDVERSLLYLLPVFPTGWHCAFIKRGK